MVTRIEDVETHLPEMLGDLNTDLSDMRATQGAQGREIDEVGGELVSVTQQLRKFKELVDRSEAQQSLANQRIRTLEKRFDDQRVCTACQRAISIPDIVARDFLSNLIGNTGLCVGREINSPVIIANAKRTLARAWAKV